MWAALDTNVLAYAEGVGDPDRCDKARSLVAQMPLEQVLLPAQTLGELYRVLTGKAGFDANHARAALLSWADTFETADSTWSAFQGAVDIAADHRLQIWDALILSVAAENGCRLLLSEDLQDGFTWHGVTVVNPFAASPSPLLEDFLGGA
jgi:predicted nucleic acid-binding protein